MEETHCHWLFPTIIAGDTLESLAELVEMLDHRGRNNITNNPAQLAPAEALIPARRDPQKAEALAEACAILIGRTDDPGVLLLCAHLGASKHEVFYRAVVERLEGGPPIPDVAGMAEATLVDELANTLASSDFGRFPDLHRRAIDDLTKRGQLRAALFVLSSSDPNKVGTDLLIEVLKSGPVDSRTSTVIGLLIWRMAKSGSSRLLDVASALSGAAQDLRVHGAQRAEQGNARWWAEHGTRFKAIAGVR